MYCTVYSIYKYVLVCCLIKTISLCPKINQKCKYESIQVTREVAVSKADEKRPQKQVRFSNSNAQEKEKCSVPKENCAI